MPYYAPVEKLDLNQNSYVFNEYLSIEKNPYDINRFYETGFLSSYEKDELAHITDWLIIHDNFPQTFYPSTILNLFLLSVWIVGPHNLKIKYRFKNYNEITIFHDHFHYNTNETMITINNEVLDEAKLYFTKGENIYKLNKRLHTAMINSFYGCASISYKVSYMCFSAALETLLSYEKGFGLTKRLAKTYACLTESQKRNRDAAYRKFLRLYNFRSDIVHGNLRKMRNPDLNLKRHAEFSKLIRKVWQTVLSDNSILSILEKSNCYRKKFFKRRELGYRPPS